MSPASSIATLEFKEILWSARLPSHEHTLEGGPHLDKGWGLLKRYAVVVSPVKFDHEAASMRLQCAFCHSTIEISFAPGIEKRLDVWANRDLNLGCIVSLAFNLKPFSDQLGVAVATKKKVFNSWKPGRSRHIQTRVNSIDRLFLTH